MWASASLNGQECGVGEGRVGGRRQGKKDEEERVEKEEEEEEEEEKAYVLAETEAEAEQSSVAGGGAADNSSEHPQSADDAGCSLNSPVDAAMIRLNHILLPRLNSISETKQSHRAVK
ncbi:unnamed protein product [Hydatigera taeniaeformis]|uniref:Uncharacterized protein n=1 Tax=Hydatigena taeniaeformis TaxID=6205 RepID=A0A3P7FJJ5_HYDTA|nr:unnamed protein product [Hydatigera taeniaeformis]